MQTLFEDLDFTGSIRDIQFTRRARRQLANVIRSGDLEQMDAAQILAFLLSRLELVSFHDHLKRYLFQQGGLEGSLKDIPTADFIRILDDSFRTNRAPHSFTPTSVRWHTTLRRWLEQDSVQRSTIFLLGFGLHMNADDVSTFLTKVQQESDFRPFDPFEIICWYCFRHGLAYPQAAPFFAFFQEVPTDSQNSILYSGCDALLEKFRHAEAFPEKWDTLLTSDDDLYAWLYCLKKNRVQDQREDLLYRNFRSLYDKCLETIRELYLDDETRRREQAGPADLERMLCDGIPLTEGGNRRKMSNSLLSRHFRQKRLTRQRLDGLLKGTLQVERFDLITLQFFLSAMSDETFDTKERCQYFLDDINYILEECGMMELYPVNAYEAFVTMCMASEYPLEMYCDVVAASYTDSRQ